MNCPTCGVAVSVEMTGGEPYCPRCRTRLEVLESASAVWPVLDAPRVSPGEVTITEATGWPHQPAATAAGVEPLSAAAPTEPWANGATAGATGAAGGVPPAAPGSPAAWSAEPGPAPSSGAEAFATATAGSTREGAGAPPVVLPDRGPAAGGRGRSAWAWQALLTYASLVTLLALYLAWQLSRQPARSRLDLPDIAPPRAKGSRVTTLFHVLETQRLPMSHVLRLGETRQFGAVEVTPLKVTRGPLRFEYFDKQITRQREPSEEVWQLHVRFRNLSSDLPVIPLDRHLVYTREEDLKRPGRFKANNFVALGEGGGEATPRVPLYDLSPDSDWVVVNQNLDQELPPGGSVEAFLPTESQGLEQLTGPLTWRFHFRKGHNPQSLRGVTTVVEVRFDAGEVEAASAEAPPVPVPPTGGPETTTRWPALPRAAS
ncbi:MAG: hypothetical protein ACKO3P_04620 [Planctomycetaceae bacterium]